MMVLIIQKFILQLENISDEQVDQYLSTTKDLLKYIEEGTPE